ncbi:CobW family GTP-binding protein [Litorilituus sediminis]|uniref:GTP-binding protein n=1 Tax=Litorilituus sediminis TaxID=718192 RepID=A0A4P6P710_9GAMM|nr:GTP-binding protein [Litorilituus sediminis]QBG36828.1 GTP-binding protein [Litorilituus sediminis]
MSNEKIIAVPTNIITGFLGVGKTSAILHLLKQKPNHERWAILVNEFGEIGVDASLMQGSLADNNDVYIREVPGGCMCCASGLPMQITLNQLLTEAKPHRLLIEPTGLGHPKEVLQVLSNQYYQEVLSLEKTICLVDARNLNDQRYHQHPTFNQQLEIADIIVGSKLDLYKANEQSQLTDFIQTKALSPEKVDFIEHGQLPLAWLAGKTSFNVSNKSAHKHQPRTTSIAPTPLPKEGYIQATNQGEGFQSIGWRFAPSKQFNRKELHSFLSTIKAVRIKAVFITPEGIFAYNTLDNDLVEIELDECNESRIEIICHDIDESWQDTLLNIVISN